MENKEFMRSTGNIIILIRQHGAIRREGAVSLKGEKTEVNKSSKQTS